MKGLQLHIWCSLSLVRCDDLWRHVQGMLLTVEETTKIMSTALKESAVGNNPTRLCEDLYELKTGKPIEATRGLDDRMNVNKEIKIRIANEVDGIQEEVELLATAESSDCKEVLEWLNYIRFEKSSEKQYANGIRDKGRKAVNLNYFLTCKIAKQARLTEAEVVALRLYTTPAFKFINIPLRDDKRHNRGEPCPLPVTTHYATSGIKKLRGPLSESNHEVINLWRGMKNKNVAANFMLEGGTEFGFMSTTTDLEVAVRYSISQNCLLFKIAVRDFMSMGAELKWISAFPGEAEVLYPPLTFLKPTGRFQSMTVDRNGQLLSVKVIEVQLQIS
jgi:hypothetical protein